MSQQPNGIHHLAFIQSLKVYMIEIILCFQQIYHSIFNGLNNDYATVEVGFLVHVVDYPICKRTQKISFAKLDNAFRALCFGSSFFV